MSTDIETGGNTFPRSARLRTPQQFKGTFLAGRRLNTNLFRMHVRLVEHDPKRNVGPAPTLPEVPDGGKESGSMPIARLGVSISKRVSTKAVERNRIRRIVRDSFRSLRLKLPPGDYVLLAQREAAGVPNATLHDTLSTLWRRAAALKPVVCAPTMPIPASRPADSEPSSPASLPQ
jgi:ribonuclease P protein component